MIARAAEVEASRARGGSGIPPVLAILPATFTEGETSSMKLETIAVHGGYSPDPTTKAVAVPI